MVTFEASSESRIVSTVVFQRRDQDGAGALAHRDGAASASLVARLAKRLRIVGALAGHARCWPPFRTRRPSCGSTSHPPRRSARRARDSGRSPARSDCFALRDDLRASRSWSVGTSARERRHAGHVGQLAHLRRDGIGVGRGSASSVEMTCVSVSGSFIRSSKVAIGSEVWLSRFSGLKSKCSLRQQRGADRAPRASVPMMIT